MPERFGSNESTYDLLRASTTSASGASGGGGSGGDAAYLRLDTTNDPLVGPLDIRIGNANALRVLTGSGAYVFPTNAVLDDFNRADGGPPPSASWTTPSTAEDGLYVTGNNGTTQPGASTECQGVWNTFTAVDTECYATMVGNSDGEGFSILLAARIQNIDHLNPADALSNYYYLSADWDSGVSHIYLGLMVNGTPSSEDQIVSWNIGDALGFAVTDSGADVLLTAYRKEPLGAWQQIGQTLDGTAAHTTAGYIGAWMAGSDSAVDSVNAIDDFGGGAIVAGTVGATFFNVDSVGGDTTVTRLVVTQATGTAPLDITSTTLVTNLNADLLDGLHAAAFAQLDADNVFTGANTFQDVTTTAGRRQAVSVQGGDYTLTATDEVIVFTATATATLPAATGSGQTYRIVCRAGTTTIDGDGTDTIKGATTQALYANEDLIITDTAAGVWE